MGDWRLCAAGLTLLAEVNLLYPDRDKRTDGTISGHPGSISSHNVNSAGVVCAVDITTGDYGDGISTADGQWLAERLRIACRDQPRGITTYGIHYMAPPYVDVAGPKICSAPDYEWRPYGGPALHKDHQHWSFDYDIYAGEAASGLADYDSTLPWLSTTLEEMDIDMATPEQAADAFWAKKIVVDGQEARAMDWLVAIVKEVRAVPKKNDVLTAADGKTKSRVVDILANLGPDLRAVKTKTDKLK